MSKNGFIFYFIFFLAGFWISVSETIYMAESVAENSGKKLIRIDISSDTVCPWCFVGKKNLDRAIASSQNQYEFEVPNLLAFL